MNFSATNCPILTRKPNYRKENARQRCMYESALQTNLHVKFAGPLAPATASATASALRASADGAPVTSGSRLSDMAPCLVLEETDPLQICNLTAGSRGNLPLARKTPAKYFLPLLSGMVANFSIY